MQSRRWAVLAAVVLSLFGCQRTPPPPAARAVASYVAVLAPVQPKRGPVADYETVSGLTLHVEVEEMVPELRPALSRYLGGRLLIAGYSAPEHEPEDGDVTAMDLSLIWMRDYQPIYIRDAAGRLSVVHYLAENPNRSAFRPPAPAPDRTSQTWMPTPDGGRWLPSRLMPLLHENGNLIVAGRRVFVSDKIIEDNLEVREAPHLLAQGYRPRRPEEVVRTLARALERRPGDIVVLPQMPYEATGHLDVFLLPLDDETVMVPRIEERSLEMIRGRAKVVGREVRDFLDEQALHLESLGLKVPRFPMLPPALALIDDDDAPEEEGQKQASDAARAALQDFELLVFSPANSLLVNVAAGRAGEAAVKLALLPGFDRAFEDPAMRARAAAYTRIWERALARRGFTSVVVDASELVGYLGLFHCVSAPIPLR